MTDTASAAPSEREQFEAHATERGYKLARGPNDSYQYRDAAVTWKAWQARAALTTAAAAAAPSEREKFERHVKAYTGRDIEYHERNGTTGLEFGWACWQVARAQPTASAADQEPFGYFRAGPFGWTDCAEADEGAVALYERPTQPAVVEPRMPVGNATLERLREWERDGELLERVWGTLVDQETEIGQLRSAARAPTDSQPALDRDRIREIFMAHGFTVKEGQTDLKQYVYDAADALLRATRAPVDSVLEDAERYHYLRDVPMAEWPDELATAFRMQQNAIWDAAIDAARKQGANHD